MKAAASAIALLCAGAMVVACEFDDDGMVCPDATSTPGDATAGDAPASDGAGAGDGSHADGAPETGTDEGDAAPAEGGGEGGSDGPAGDAHPDATSDDGEAGPLDASREAEAAAVTVSSLRVANFSPDSPPIDFCLAPHGTGSFSGPLMTTLAGSNPDPMTDPTSLAFPNVSAYVQVAPGKAYDVRTVVVGSTSCAPPGLSPDATTLPVLAPGAYLTVAMIGQSILGDGGSALQLVGWPDTPKSSAVAMRFVNASPDLGTVDFGCIGSCSGSGGTAFTALFPGVGFGKVGTAAADAGAADTNGYLTQPAFSGADLGVRAGTKVSVSGMDTAAAGSVLTYAAVGTVAGMSLQLFRCVDNAGTVGSVSRCAKISP